MKESIEREPVTDRSWILTQTFTLIREKAKALKQNDSKKVKTLRKAVWRNYRGTPNVESQP